MLNASGITKRFGRTLALDRANLRAWPSEIHALIGENGAGKSTLINILAGRIRADAGRVELSQPAVAASAPAERRRDIAAVYQSPLLFERMSWEENLALAGFGGAQVRLKLDEVAQRAGALAEELGFALPPRRALVAELSVSARVRIAIARALSFDPRVLILDEPTGLLAPAELENFLALLRRLRSAGRIIIIVTHKLAEALAVADRVTVLRGGRNVIERPTAETDVAELARLMVGNLPPAPVMTTAASTSTTVAVALALDQIVCEQGGRRVIDGATLRVMEGEIVGVAGVDGNGQTELVALLAGLLGASSGAMVSAQDVAVIPQNRDRDSLILTMTLWENLLLAQPLRARFTSRWGGLHRRAAKAFCSALLDRFAIRAAGPAAAAATLSGGNRQRLTVARALASQPRVIVAHDVCRGLDVRAAAEVYRRFRAYAAAGGAVLLISGDLEELLALCTRVYVISRGRTSEVAAADRDPAHIGLMMSGHPA